MADTSSRRFFLSRLLGGTLLTGCAGMLASVVAYLFPSTRVSSALGPQHVRVGAAAQMKSGEGKLALVEDEPVWVVRSGEGFTALSAWCTHEGCIVKWEQPRRVFSCPCHEGSFDEHGNVVSGLPRRPLRSFRVGFLNGDVYVSRGERI